MRLISSVIHLCVCLLLPSAVVLAAPKVIILGDMEKPTGGQKVESSPDFFSGGKIHLHGAANEVVAFQVLLQATGDEEGLDLRVGDLKGPVLLPAGRHVQLFLEHYIRAQDASYSWQPSAAEGVLPWRGLDWPDALIPFTDPYGPAGVPVAVPFAIYPRERRNQAVWIDLFIPPDAPAGDYVASVECLQNGQPYATLPLTLTVHPFRLPDENHVDAYGELYRETGEMFDSGVKFSDKPEADWTIYRRYLQMAHAHRFLAVHRAGYGPMPNTPGGGSASQLSHRWGSWQNYLPYTVPILSGRLFTDAEGYVGPSPGTPPAFFPAPFTEKFYGADSLRKHLEAHGGAIDPALLEVVRGNAAAFEAQVRLNGWDKIRFFAYIFDEVDGTQDTGEGESKKGSGKGTDETAQFHATMRAVQQALDAGAGGRRIHLLWTSHIDPSTWVGTPADLRGAIDWWVPNGHAANPKFFSGLADRPAQTVWFYHSGRPAIGNHSINQLGIDLRLWGLLCARYNLQGSFWWSMMSFPKKWDAPNFNPYDNPTYKASDTRWGNGVLFYPGSRLTLAGARRNIDGPVPSLRMKAYRRGLQDCEYVWLARQRGHAAEADALLRKLIPAALGEAPKGAAPATWGENPADYYRLRRDLAALIE